MKGSTKRKSVSYAKWGYIFILPFFAAFLIFQLIPLASTIYYSFFEYYRSGLTIIGPNFVGLENYKALLGSDFTKYMGNTLILWIIGFPFICCRNKRMSEVFYETISIILS